MHYFYSQSKYCFNFKRPINRNEMITVGLVEHHNYERFFFFIFTLLHIFEMYYEALLPNHTYHTHTELKPFKELPSKIFHWMDACGRNYQWSFNSHSHVF